MKPHYSNQSRRIHGVNSRWVRLIPFALGAVLLIPGLLSAACPSNAQAGRLHHKQVTWNFDRVPLSVFVATLESELGRPVSVDWPALAEDGVTPDTPISIQLRGLPIRSAVNLALHPLRLRSGWNDDQSLEITSLLSEPRLIEREYPVGDLLTGSGEVREQIANELWEIVQQYAFPNSWSSVGGDGENTINTSDGMMVISQSHAAHESVAQLLKMLRTGDNPSPSEYESQILRALDQRISCDLDDEPLETAVRHLCNLGKIENVVFDTQALQEEGVSLDNRVSLHVYDLPLQDALKKLLYSTGLTSLVKYDALVVTSWLEAGNDLEYRIVRVNNLMGSPPDPDGLIRIIENSVYRNSWATVGGAGTISQFTTRSLLLVHQTRTVHNVVEQFLEALRTGTQRFETVDDRRVLAAMKRTVQFDFRYAPLGGAIESLCASAGLKQIVIDRLGLTEEGMSVDVPITFRGRHISAGAALKLLLEQFNLGWTIENGALRVTSLLECDRELAVRIYPVADLVDALANGDELIDMIEDTIDPFSWSKIGGAGEIYHFEPKRCLVVLNSPPVQSQVTRLLRRVRGFPDAISSANERISQALSAIYNWRFENGTIDQLADRLADGLDCTVMTRELGVPLSQRISVATQAESLETALARALGELNLVAIVRDGALLITHNLE